MAIEVGRIEKEFILKHIIESKSPIELMARGTKVQATLKAVKDDEFVFEAKNPSFDQVESPSWLDVFFLFRGTRVTCRTTLSKVSQDEILVKLPNRLYRDLTREFERVYPVSRININLIMESTRLKLNFPASTAYSEPTAPDSDQKWDQPDIPNLLKSFTESAKTFANEHKIVMFREQKPSRLVEHLIALSGKLLLLPFSLVKPGLSQDDSAEFLDEAAAAAIIEATDSDRAATLAELGQYRESLATPNIFCELYVPILFRQYVIGFVYLNRKKSNATVFPGSVIAFTRQFSQDLAYALYQNSYFPTEKVRDFFTQSDLIDISGNGLQFAMPADGPDLGLFDDLDIELQIRDQVIPIKVRVVRQFSLGDKVYYGLKFLNVSHLDRAFLLKFLYGEASETPPGTAANSLPE